MSLIQNITNKVNDFISNHLSGDTDDIIVQLDNNDDDIIDVHNIDPSTYRNPHGFMSFLNGHPTVRMKDYSKEDIEVLIREINISTMLGELDITPKLDKIDQETIDICQKLSKDGAVIGGSLLLKSCGLLNRDNDDIDILWDINEAKEKGIIKSDDVINHSMDYHRDDQDRFNTREQEIERYKVDTKEFGILDIFNIDEPVYHTVNGVNFANPLKTIRAKLEYFREKDVEDYHYIKNIVK